MKYAVFSDVHASKEGLDKLLRHSEFLSTDRKVCLGDIFNAHQPETTKEYFERVRSISDVIISGNHEAYLASKCDATVFSSKIYDQLVNSKTKLLAEEPDFIKELANLPQEVVIGEAHFTHASFDQSRPWSHVRYTEDVQAQAPSLTYQISIAGHGHIPFIAWLENGLWYYQRQVYETTFYFEKGITYLLNTGSVLGSREMREKERTFLVYDDTQASVTFYNLEAS